MGSDDGVHVMEFQAGGLMEIANPFTAETIEALAVGYRADPPVNHANGGRIPIVAAMFAVDASPVAVVMEDGRTFTQTNTAGGGVAIMDGRIYYANGVSDVNFAEIDTITGDNWTDAYVFGDDSDSNPIFGADNAMDAGGGMIAMADTGGLSWAKNLHGPNARSAVDSEEIWAVCQTTNLYTTAWMLGETRVVWLADSKTTDRGPNGVTLTEVGTVTEGEVASGADIQGYSGWSATNYLTVLASADFHFGTDPDCVLMLKFWLQMGSSATGTQTIMDMEDSPGNDSITIEWVAGTGIRVSLLFETNTGDQIVSSTALAADDTCESDPISLDTELA